MKILFLGNSLTYYNQSVVHDVATLFSNSSNELEQVDKVLVGGATLKTLWRSSNATRLIQQNNYDIVVIQEDLPETTIAKFHTYAEKFINLVRQHKGRPILFMAWAYNRLPALTNAMVEQAHLELAKRVSCDVAPVLLARLECESITALNIPTMYAKDMEHPSVAGTFLAALVLFVTITGSSRDLLKSNASTYAPQGVDANVAIILQHVATSIAGTNRWRFESTTTEEPEVPDAPKVLEVLEVPSLVTHVPPPVHPPASLVNPPTTSTTPALSLSMFPMEMIKHILRFSTAHGLMQGMFTCTSWSSIIRSPLHDQKMWEPLYRLDYPNAWSFERKIYHMKVGIGRRSNMAAGRLRRFRKAYLFERTKTIEQAASTTTDQISVTLARDVNGVQLYHDFVHTPKTETILINNTQQLRSFLTKITKNAVQTRKQWMRNPTSTWVTQLFNALTPQQQETVQEAFGAARKQQHQTSTIDDKWDENVELSTRIIELWCEGKTLQDVVLKSKELGHSTLPLGYVIEGRILDQIGMKKQVTFEELVNMLSTLNEWEKKNSDEMNSTNPHHQQPAQNQPEQKNGDESSRVLLYQTQPQNSFSLCRQKKVQDYQVSLNDLSEKWANTTRTTRTTRTTPSSTTTASSSGPNLDGCGCLNSIFDYRHTGDAVDLPQEIDLLHAYYNSMSAVCDRYDINSACANAFELNQLIYMIFKFHHYCTCYHQDVHISPHFTMYSQTSGCSVFHFLPVLIGLYIGTNVPNGNTYSKNVADMLRELDDLKIGNVATVAPGQVVLIMPSGSHGVFVPLVERKGGINSHLGVEPFDVSLIRAAEIIISVDSLVGEE